MKKNRGITLIALIITVILLLILVGVSVNVIIKGNLFSNAQKAVDGTNAKVNEQQSAIDELMNEWEQMEGDFCSHIWKDGETLLEPTCTVCGVEEIEIIPATGVHTYGEWKVTKQATCTADGTKTRTCTGCGATQSQVIAKLGHNFVNGTCTRCGEKRELVIGANINYHEYISESGGTVSASYTSTKTTRGSTDSNDLDATYSVVNNSGIQWIVLGEENGQIKITTKNIVQPTLGGYGVNLLLTDQTGYANGIDELNKISAVYGKGKYADTTKFSTSEGTSGGRSFKMEDLGYGALTRTASYKYARHSDGKIYRYDAGATVDGTSTEGGSYDTFNYMALDASSVAEETTSSHALKTLSKNIYSQVTMYQYTYSGSQTLPTEVSKADTYYWLASRSLYCDSSNVNYKVYYVNYDLGAKEFYLYSSERFFGNVKTAGVRPVVYLKSDIQLSYDSSSGYTISE